MWQYLSMDRSHDLNQLKAEELRDLSAALLAQLTEKDAALSAKTNEISRKDQELRTQQLKIDQLTREMATLKRWRLSRSGERLDSPQRSLLEESIDEDLEAIDLEIQAIQPHKSPTPKRQPRREVLPKEFPRREIPMSRSTRCAGAVVRSSGSARTSVRGWTMTLEPSQWNAMCVANGSAANVRR
jgi:hypothetical protein